MGALVPRSSAPPHGGSRAWALGFRALGLGKLVELNPAYLKDPKLWELWSIPH